MSESFQYILRRPVILALLAIIIVIAVAEWLGLLNRPHLTDPSHLVGARVALTGVIANIPDPRPKGTVVILDVETIRELKRGQPTQSVSGRTLVQIHHWPDTFASPGDRIRVLGQLHTPRPARIPGTFDYQQFLKSRGIHSIIYASSRSATNLGVTQKFKWHRLGWKLHSHVVTIFKKHLPEDQAAVLSGLVVGSRPRFHPEIKRIFVESGTMHILVASGSNVAFVVALWFLIVRLLFRFSRTWSLLTSLPAIWIYVLMVGLDPPITRAGIMTTVAIISYVLAREDRAYNAFAMAALVILLFNPGTLFEVGFQMSFVTVFGMIYFLPRIDQWITTENFWWRWILRLGAATMTAQLWLVPITLGVFKRFYPIGIISNLLIIPWAAGGLGLGFLLVLTDILLPPVVPIIREITFLYLNIMISGVRFFADTPGLVYWASVPGIFWVVGFYLAALSIVGIRQNKWCRVIVGFSIVMMAGSTGSAVRENKIHHLTMTWLDTGRNLSVIIQTPDVENIVINPENEERILNPYLAHKRIRKITHSINTRENSEPTQVGDLKITPLPGSKAFQTRTPLFIEYKDKRILIAHVLSLKTQRFIVEQGWKNFDVIQARFSGKIKWEENFVRQVRPKLLIENGYDTVNRPSVPPWNDIEKIVPQKVGYFIWNPQSRHPGESQDPANRHSRESGNPGF